MAARHETRLVKEPDDKRKQGSLNLSLSLSLSRSRIMHSALSAIEPRRRFTPLAYLSIPRAREFYEDSDNASPARKTRRLVPKSRFCSLTRSSNFYRFSLSPLISLYIIEPRTPRERARYIFLRRSITRYGDGLLLARKTL